MLRDAAGAQVASGRGATGALDVSDVRLWAPGDGYLYDLEVQLVDEAGIVRDSVHQHVGVRTVEVRGTEFLVNGKPFYFKGFGMHEDHAILGKGHDDAHLVHDFELLDWIGANSFRTSHYPYAEDVLDYADRHGIVVIDETAAVGLNMGLGGGIFGGQGNQTFSPRPSTTTPGGPCPGHPGADRPRQEPSQRRPLVDRERAGVGHRRRRELLRPLFAVARQADPTRPVGFVNVMLAPHGACRVSQFADVLMLNRYYGWYVNTGDLAGAELAWTELEAGHPRASRSSSPSTARTPCPATTPSPRSPGARSTRSNTST